MARRFESRKLTTLTRHAGPGNLTCPELIQQRAQQVANRYFCHTERSLDGLLKNISFSVPSRSRAPNGSQEQDQSSGA
ncbi:hypothetical protein ZHAS_00007919 [Anopheles sinensis]|uniref:Uncharacterized protein n=1 Tax=Anopheles sinensis TaxID=74873 RepID=A0A084VR39_ANOSI|nr:hypothetical protein ZHAS_00007919 [Anopheles sinensis]